MTRAIPFLGLLRSAAPTAIIMLVIAIFGGYAVVGKNGVLAWGDYSRQLDQQRVELSRLEKQKALLQNRVALLDPRKANPDMADELIRRELGLAHPDEVIVPLN
ncbi:septum formation initiator family protein [Sphingomonas sp. LaA6.9]|uniref:FtsB family cell division protein n=1 Tax=Sphingomonas sp. LaA6.9 TaxID=2919914 RepID=UPI001F4F56BA|nr:septum formation initiator family protein [Sphingomonas sp. LaA6.9]MCJ8156190.1 septum formation initiator family protein [Sphingomonas sp. LaA6.9]